MEILLSHCETSENEDEEKKRLSIKVSEMQTMIFTHRLPLFFFASSTEKCHSTDPKLSQTMDENCNFINEFDFTSTESHYPLIPNDFINKSVNSFDEFVNDENDSSLDGTRIKSINPKLSLTARATPLDAIVEDVNEENSDEFHEHKQHPR